MESRLLSLIIVGKYLENIFMIWNDFHTFIFNLRDNCLGNYLYNVTQPILNFTNYKSVFKYYNFFSPYHTSYFNIYV